MGPENNLHATIPAVLLAEAEKIAAVRHLSIDELMQDAVICYLDENRWRDIYTYGEQQARKLGIREEDVDRILHDFRQRESAHQKE